MPKQTFHNLDEKKKAKITNAFLREFAIHSYDDASLSSVVESLGIAKGSIYQYFDGKKDLFIYLIRECSAVKSEYVGGLQREDYPDFWAYFHSLYESGVKFDLENPLESHFLHSLLKNLNSPSMLELYDTILNQTIAGFETMVRDEIARGGFRSDLPPETIGFFLYKASRAINEQMEVLGHIDPRESIKNNKPVYQGKIDVLIQIVDEYIEILKPALRPKKTDDTR